MKISIIIPVFNNLAYTKNCLINLESEIINNPKIKDFFEIVVVDDGSADGTAAFIIENHPDVHLVSGDGNLWWSGGINKGVKYSMYNLKVDYVLWWNNDVIIHPGYFTNLVEIVTNDTNKNTLIGSKVFILNRNLIWGMGGVFNPKTGVRHMIAEKHEDGEKYMTPISVDWFPGMGTTIPVQVFEKIGFLDEKLFPQYHGDSDFTFRAKKSGYELLAFPQLIIYNDNTNTGMRHGGSLKGLYKSLTSVKSNFHVGRDIKFYRKHSTSSLAYIQLLSKYFRYVGGFFKWKVLNMFNITKNIK